MISCEDLISELSEYLDDEVSLEQRRQLEKHLAGCRPCRVVADTARSTVKIVTECGSFDLPPKLSSKIMAKVKAAAGSPSGGEPAPRAAKTRPARKR